MTEASRPLLFWDVDTQVDFMREAGKLYVPGAEQIAGNLGRLTAGAARHGVPVVASADDHEPGDEELSDEPDFETTYPPHCLRGTPGADRIPETRQHWTLEVGHRSLEEGELRRGVAGERPAVLVHKKRFDVFSNPNAERLLEVLAPRRVVVYGVALDVCNRAAIDGLLARGVPAVTLVTDATKPIDAGKAEGLLAGWRARGVEMRTTDEVLADLESGALG